MSQGLEQRDGVYRHRKVAAASTREAPRSLAISPRHFHKRPESAAAVSSRPCAECLCLTGVGVSAAPSLVAGEGAENFTPRGGLHSNPPCAACLGRCLERRLFSEVERPRECAESGVCLEALPGAPLLASSFAESIALSLYSPASTGPSPTPAAGGSSAGAERHASLAQLQAKVERRCQSEAQALQTRLLEAWRKHAAERRRRLEALFRRVEEKTLDGIRERVFNAWTDAAAAQAATVVLQRRRAEALSRMTWALRRCCLREALRLFALHVRLVHFAREGPPSRRLLSNCLLAWKEQVLPLQRKKRRLAAVANAWCLDRSARFLRSLWNEIRNDFERRSRERALRERVVLKWRNAQLQRKALREMARVSRKRRRLTESEAFVAHRQSRSLLLVVFRLWRAEAVQAEEEVSKVRLSPAAVMAVLRVVAALHSQHQQGQERIVATAQAKKRSLAHCLLRAAGDKAVAEACGVSASEASLLALLPVSIAVNPKRLLLNAAEIAQSIRRVGPRARDVCAEERCL